MERGWGRSGVARGRRADAGSALVETVVALPVLLLVTLGAVQWALIYEAKANLEYAALMAARAGAVEHADAEAIRKGLARGLLGLYSPPKNLAGAVRTLRTRVLPDVTDHTRIRILNPTVEAFDDFAEPNREGVVELPNLDLHLRPTDRGAASGLNIQDANLLKLEVLYGYELQVPLVGPLIAGLAQWWQRDADARRMLADRRLPILASAVVRLQSPARRNELMVRRDGSTPGRDLAGGGAGSGPGSGAGDSTRPGDSQDGDGRGPAGGWSPVAQRTVPYRPSPAPAAPGDAGGGAGADPRPKVPPIVDDPGAGNFDQCRFDDTLAAVTPDQPAQQTGNPVHVVTGNKYQRETDLEPLPGVLGLRFVRHYNSRVHRWRAAGFGWRHSYDVSLTAHGDGRVVVHQADGRAIAFSRDRARPGPSDPSFDASRVHEVASRPGDHDSGTRLSATRIEDGTLEVLPGRNGYVWRWRNGRRLHFDADGRLQRIETAGGARTSLSYDPEGRLVQVRDPQHRYLQLFYDRFDRLVRITDPGGLHTEYVYDAHNNLTAVHYADDTVRRYHYEDPNDPHNLTGITDARGVRFATYAYDRHDRAVLSTHAGNVGKVTLQYQPGRTEVTDAQGRTTVYHTRLEQGVPLVTRIDGPGCTACAIADVRYEYNDRFQVTAVIGKSGSVTEYAFDDRHRLTSIQRRTAAGDKTLVKRYAYRGEVHQPVLVARPSVVSGKLHSFMLRYNSHGQVVGVLESGARPDGAGDFTPVFRELKYEYAGGHLSAIDGPLPGTEDVTRYERGYNGLLIRIIRPTGLITKIEARDRFGRPTRVVAPNRVVTTLSYNVHGQAVVLKVGALTYRVAYGREGHPIEVVRPDGSVLRAEYDTAGRLTRIVDAEGNAIQFGRDREDNLTSVGVYRADRSFQLQQTSEYGPDARLRALVGAAGTSRLERDHAGRVTRSIAPGGRETRYQYDPLGRVRALVEAAGSDVEAVTAFEYDAHDRVTALTDARNNTTRLVYDDLGLKVAEVSPDAGIQLYRYDAAGRRIARIDERGVITQFHYDAAGRLTGVGAAKQPPNVTLRYEGTRLIERAGANQTTQYAYDQQGRVTKKTERVLGRVFVTAYRYDSATGKLHEKVLPDGQVLRYHYAPKTGALRALSRKEFIGQRPVIGELQYLPFGPVASYTHGNGIRTALHYDAAGRIAQLKTDRIQRLTYAYDDAGNITGIQRNDRQERYGYDAADRLTKAQLADARYEWTYDKLGNRLTESRDKDAMGDFHYARDSNRLLTARNATYRYDHAGNPVQAGSRRFIYDAAGRPRAVYADETLVALYAYNSAGHRIAKTVYANGKIRTTLYLYEDNRLVAEANEQGQVTRHYLYLDHRPVALLKGRQIYFIHTDHLGTPRLITDEDAKIAWRANYSPFGHATVTEASLTNNLRFPGQYYDQETGLHYNLMRYYDPDTGRYLTGDPLGTAAGPNPYAYVTNDPLGRYDPLGLYGIEVHYYMTYFLAVVAGVPQDQSKVIASAAQYVDDNSRTSPLSLLAPLNGAWERYHFTLDYRATPFYGDQTNRILKRFENPRSAQLTRLYQAAYRTRNSVCTKAQLFGEYLHALEDTFSHRDRSNRPYATANDAHNDPPATIGHLVTGDWGHAPDHTYNQYRQYRVKDPTAIPGGQRFYVDQWAFNEVRTLAMEKAVFERMLDFAKNSGAILDSAAWPVQWEDLAGAGDARIALPGNSAGVVDDAGNRVVGYQAPRGPTGVLQQFNAFNEDTDTYVAKTGNRAGEEMSGIKAKAQILNDWLAKNGFSPFSRSPAPGKEVENEGNYDEDVARQNRKQNLEGLDPDDYPGIILDTEWF